MSTLTISGLCPADGPNSISCSGTDIFGTSGAATFALKGKTLTGSYTLTNPNADFQGFTFQAVFDRSTAPKGIYLETLTYNGDLKSAATSVIDATVNPLQFSHFSGSSVRGASDGTFTATFTLTPEPSTLATVTLCLPIFILLLWKRWSRR